MKETLFTLTFLLLTTIAFSQCNDPSLEYYLKRPPIMSSFVITEDRNEKIELALKDIYSFSQLEIEFDQLTGSGWENNNYIMYDDGTHGDETANDKIFTSNEVLLKHLNTTTYKFNNTTINVIYKNNNIEVHSDVFSLSYISLSTDFIENIDRPNTFKFDNEDYLFTDKFIYYNKYNNWSDLECNQLGGVLDVNYVISKSLLYDFWGENVINNNNDKNLYMQVDFSPPNGQFLSGQDLALEINSLQGVEVHEILHLWIPTINSYLGFETSDTHDGHHANIFKNTSGFLYSSWSRTNGVFCVRSLNDFDVDGKGNFLFIDHTTSYELCNNDLATSGDKLKYNDFELYLMNLIPIEEVSFPITSLKNIYNIEQIIDSNTGLLTGEKHYFDSIIEINQEQLAAAKNEMLNDLGSPSFLDASNPNNFLLTFSGNKSNLSNNEIKMLWVLSNDLTTTNDKLQENSSNTFYKATGERSEITSNIPLPMQYTGDFFTTEYITIEGGENYNGWTVSGEYTRTLNSTQYKDSIVTTQLTVNDVLSIDELDLNRIKIYPNPTNTNFFIEWDDFKTCIIYNSNGQIIKSSSKKNVSVSDLHSGVYFIKLVGIIDKRIHYSKIIIK